MAASKVDTIVHGGTVVTATHTFQGSVAIRGEKIVAVGPDDALPDADKYIDASGKYVFPGAIDAHSHFDNMDPYELGIKAGALAGLTTVMPFSTYDVANKETLPQAINRLKERLSKESVLDYTFHFILDNPEYILESLPEALQMGVTSYKVFMTYKKSLTRMCSDAFIAKAMDVIAEHNGIMQLHCENGEVIDYLEDKRIAMGLTKPTDFPASCPIWVEEEAINRAINLGKMTGCPVFVVHLSTQAGLERIKRAQWEGQKVWTETCPHYLLLDESAMETLGPLVKIGPPLRPADGVNQGALWQGTVDGYISAIGSDHAPGSKELKEKGRENIYVADDGTPIPFGAPSIETLVPLVYSEGVAKRGLPLTWMARVLAENPARIFGIYPRKGAIRPGSDADLLIYDPDVEKTITVADHVGNSGYTPYEGWTQKGAPWMTLLRGKVVLNQGKLEQGPDHGEFISAGPPMPPIGGRVN